MIRLLCVIGAVLLASSTSFAKTNTYECKLVVQTKNADDSWSTQISPVEKFALPTKFDLTYEIIFNEFLGEIKFFTDPQRQPGGLISVRKADQKTPAASNYLNPLPEITDTRLALENELVVLNCYLK